MVIKNKNLAFFVDSLLVIAGGFLMALGFNLFLFPSEILPSGFSGISTIISVLFQRYLNVNVSMAVVYIILNIILYICALKFMGKRFAVLSLIGVITYTLYVQFVKFDIGMAIDPLLFAFYGGLLSGVGTGIMIRGRGSTGGSELLACIINKKAPTISVGTVLICINAVVILASVLVYGISSALYSLISIYLTGKVADIVVAGVQSVRAYYIISSKNEEIAKRIIGEVARGVTGINVSGMYTKVSQTMLLVLVNRAQVPHLKYIVADVDNGAFMFSSPVSEAMGKGFIPLKKGRASLFKPKHVRKRYDMFKATERKVFKKK